MRSVRVIGPGRVGQAMMTALAKVGWRVEPALGRGDDLRHAATGVDLVLVTTPDAAISEVARTVIPSATIVIAHTSGAQSLDALGPHERRASVHPLAAIPDPLIGTERLLHGCAFAIDGDDIVLELVEAVGGRPFRVAPSQRGAYHAAATIASNHLVALMGQVERVAATAGVPLDAYLDLAAQTLDNVRQLGPAAALTGPVARGDWATVARHLAVLDPSETDGYQALVDLARRLVHDGQIAQTS